jgi:hypothetical protein
MSVFKVLTESDLENLDLTQEELERLDASLYAHVDPSSIEGTDITKYDGSCNNCSCRNFRSNPFTASTDCVCGHPWQAHR